jgi:hypothetical protein
LKNHSNDGFAASKMILRMGIENISGLISSRKEFNAILEGPDCFTKK